MFRSRAQLVLARTRRACGPLRAPGAHRRHRFGNLLGRRASWSSSVSLPGATSQLIPAPCSVGSEKATPRRASSAPEVPSRRRIGFNRRRWLWPGRGSSAGDRRGRGQNPESQGSGRAVRASAPLRRASIRPRQRPSPPPLRSRFADAAMSMLVISSWPAPSSSTVLDQAIDVELGIDMRIEVGFLLADLGHVLVGRGQPEPGDLLGEVVVLVGAARLRRRFHLLDEIDERAPADVKPELVRRFAHVEQRIVGGRCRDRTSGVAAHGAGTSVRPRRTPRCRGFAQRRTLHGRHRRACPDTRRLPAAARAPA